MNVAFNDDASEATLEEVTDLAVSSIVGLSKLALQALHELRHIWMRSHHDQMKVIAHLAIGKNFDSQFARDFHENSRKPSTVMIVFEDRGLSITAIHHVIGGAADS